MTENYNLDTRREIVNALISFLADTAIIYYKTHGYHWNVEGSNFYSLHIMFEKFYIKLWKSMDDIAERIRAQGEKAPPSFTELLKYATVKEAEAAPSAHIMIKSLRDDYLTLAKKAHEVASLADA